MSARIRTFLKPDMFYPDSCQRGQLNSSEERFQNNAVSLSGFTWFRVDRGPIRVKRLFGFKYIRIRVDRA